MADRCEIPGCRALAQLFYLGHGVCDRHWTRFTADDQPPGALRMVLGIREAAPAKETDMSETKQTATKKAKAPRATKAKAAKPAKEKKPRPPKEDLCTFACRIAEAERDAFHKATGPAGASKFARRLMVVFAKEDEPGFRTLLKEAKEARG